MTPLRVRGYAVERLLGSGATGDVWQARVLSSGAPVALKRIVIRDDEQLRRAQAEAALLAALDHPNLVRLHTVAAADDAVVLVLDLADGGSLAALLDARGRLAPGEVITAVAPIAAALEYLHGEGVVHGDVSAANVLFTGAGVPMLADVGVARLTGDDADAEATPAYVDPAVAAGCVPGPQSDVFMVGGVALHALTGAPPWPDEDGDAAVARAARGVLDDVAQRLAGANVPPAMAAVLARALAVDPPRRGTAADLALDLAHSGQPVAVELSAGLARREPQPVVAPGPRHAAPPAANAVRRGFSAGSLTAARPDPARPSFERPSAILGAAGAAPPTRMVGPRPRPVIPRPARRRSRPRLLGAAVAVALAAALAVVGTAWARSTDRHGRGGGNTSVPRSQLETTRTPSAAEHTRPPAVIDWPAALAHLDALRAKAFGTRNPALLRQVYADPHLFHADAGLLIRLVPSGCLLSGVHTRYAGMQVAAHGADAIVTTTATLRPSLLICHGRRQARAPGVGPVRLRVQLVRTPSGVRIAALTDL